MRGSDSQRSGMVNWRRKDGVPVWWRPLRWWGGRVGFIGRQV